MDKEKFNAEVRKRSHPCILLATDLFLDNPRFIDCMNAADPTFSSRYTQAKKFYGEESILLNGESHWEADKYHIFFLQVEDAQKFALTYKSEDWCQFIGVVDDGYNVSEVLYLQPPVSALADKDPPRNIMHRPQGFKPRC